jgi:mannose-6-phosphate isomerase-like protein (cupin superfamily)
LTEFMIFLNPTKIKIGSEIFDLAPGDLAVIPPGEAHEVLTGPEGTMPIVIKLPNNPEDTKYPG